MNFYFSHRVFWCLNSLIPIYSNLNSDNFYEKLKIFIENLLAISSKEFQNKMLLGYFDLIRSMESSRKKDQHESIEIIEDIIQKYGSANSENENSFNIKKQSLLKFHSN